MSAAPASVLREDFTLLSHPDPAVQAASAAQQGLTQAQMLVIAAAVVVALVVLWIGFKWRKRVRAERASQEAHLRALQELTEWQALSDESRYREAVTAISGTLRRYVWHRYRLAAPNLTSEEISEAQRLRRPIPAVHDPFWQDFISIGDLIKYAGRHPRAQEFRRILDSSVQFVEASHASRGEAA